MVWHQRKSFLPKLVFSTTMRTLSCVLLWTAPKQAKALAFCYGLSWYSLPGSHVMYQWALVSCLPTFIADQTIHLLDRPGLPFSLSKLIPPSLLASLQHRVLVPLICNTSTSAHESHNLSFAKLKLLESNFQAVDTFGLLNLFFFFGVPLANFNDRVLWTPLLLGDVMLSVSCTVFKILGILANQNMDSTRPLKVCSAIWRCYNS